MSDVLDYRSGVDERAERGSRQIKNWWGWAAYLGMSWTWCIGMFLPVLLLRDYGLWGWIVFAIPNVIGAAAMGWVLRDGTSEIIVEQHRLALTAFSFVTATFQIFFAMWVFTWLEGPGTPWVVILSLIIFALSRGRPGSSLLLAAVVLFFSLGTIIFALRVGYLYLPLKTFSNIHPASTMDVIALSMACIFGFSLCPYLDPTFHIARQKSEAPARSFTVGFGCFFFVMILFTLEYASGLIMGDVIATPHGWHQVMPWLAWYWTIQLALTVGLQWSAIPTLDVVERRIGSQAPQIIGAMLTVLALRLLMPHLHYGKLASGELLYRCFMGFYGLLFPAYVWLCMLPGRWVRPPTSNQWAVLSVAVILAAPMFWMSFIDRQMVYVIPGLAVVLVARCFVRSLESTPVQQ